MRGKECRNMTLGGMVYWENPYPNPYPLRCIVFAVHAAKTNKEGAHQDWRAITPGSTLLQCPVFNLAIYFLQRLCVHNGHPLPESVAESDLWCDSYDVTMC